jgi:hypothetical protein
VFLISLSCFHVLSAFYLLVVKELRRNAFNEGKLVTNINHVHLPHAPVALILTHRAAGLAGNLQQVSLIGTKYTQSDSYGDS